MSETMYQYQSPGNALNTAKSKAQLLSCLKENEAFKDLFFQQYSYLEWNPNEL